jgi:23S rRNA (adenine2503-C2)-methyltransferase
MTPNARPAQGPPPLAGLRLAELEALLESRTRAIEVIRWLYAPGEAPRPPISAAKWETLSKAYALPSATVVERSLAQDGTTKYLLDLGGAQAEAVRIPLAGRTTLCLSSQSGCTRRCRFCATATLGFRRNLRADEMVEQFLVARREGPISNIVFMGMGEPMDNLDQVLHAVELFTQAPSPQLRAERITVSTSGVLPGIERFLRTCKASLALSLNGSTDEQRDRLIPHNRQWPIAELLGALRADASAHPKRAHFIEYVLLEGINDAPEDAQRLVDLMEGINARINLIPHNPFPGSPYRATSLDRARALQRQILAAGIRCFLRLPHGEDIAAACGQLARGRPAT